VSRKRTARLARARFAGSYSYENRFGMLTCYLDEAGGDKEQSLVVCGWVSTVALWERFEIDWKLLLSSHQLPYFTMKEFAQSTGPFAKWKDADLMRKTFVQHAHSIIKDRVQRLILCFVDHRLFALVNKQLRLVETFHSPYAIAGRACVAQVELWNKKRSKALEQLQYVLEDGGPDKGGLIAALDVRHKLPAASFEPSRDMPDRRGGLRMGRRFSSAETWTRQEYICPYLP
jgi:hypothetical protein